MVEEVVVVVEDGIVVMDIIVVEVVVIVGGAMTVEVVMYVRMWRIQCSGSFYVIVSVYLVAVLWW